MRRTKGKPKQWRRGQSCVSNPDNFHHRDSAKGRFFQNLGESALTKDAVAAHNNVLGSMSTEMEGLAIEAEDLRSAGKSFNTFATSFTQCTIPAFNTFFQNFNPNSESQTRMLAIHAATQEYLEERGLEQNATSYFCSLVVNLEGHLESSEEDVTAILSLMVRVIRRVNIEVLQAKYLPVGKSLHDLITRYEDSVNNPLMVNLIGTISVLLRSQSRDQWKFTYTENLLKKLLPYTLHEKPKIRKAAQYNIVAILKRSAFMVNEEEKNIHPGTDAVGNYCILQLRTASELGNTKTTLHMLLFLAQVIMTFPKKLMKASCECLLSLLQFGSENILINTYSMKAIHSLLISEPPSSLFPVRSISALITALTNRVDAKVGVGVCFVPGMNDAQLAIIWIDVLTVAHINLFNQSKDEGLKVMASWFKLLAPYWQSEHDKVQSKVLESFLDLLEQCIGTCTEETILANKAYVEVMFHSIESGMSYQYQGSWDCVFRGLESCFKVLGPHFPDLMKVAVKNLSELMGNRHVPHRRYLEEAIGSFVTAVGPKAILEVVPLQVTGDITEDEKYLWILPILRRFVKNTQLSFFEDFFVHLAGKCFLIINSLKEKGQADSIVAKTYHTIENQIWGLLPSFCNKATDVEVAMGNEKFARIICDNIRLRDDTRINMLTALRTLVNDNLENSGKLSAYAKNYLPALFNIFLTKPQGFQASNNDMESDEPTVSNGHRLAAYSTIKTYLQIVPQPKCHEFLGLVMRKYNDEKDDFKKQAFLDLARSFLPYIDSSLVLRLFNKIKPVLETKSGRHVEKAAYRLMEEMLSIQTEACHVFVNDNLNELLELLLKTTSAAALSSRAPRLRCMRHVLLQLKIGIEEENLNEIIQQVVGESVMCCAKSNSNSLRKAGFLLLSEVGATIQKHTQCTEDETVTKCINLLLAGLTGSTKLAANSIFAITSLIYQYKDIITVNMLRVLIDATCLQLSCHTREVVEACLSFIKSLLIAFPIPVMTFYVEDIVGAICKMVPDCQSKFRRTTRDIFDRLMRKFGADRIMAGVPSDNEKLQKRLYNLEKIAARKKRNREENRGAAGRNDDEDFESTALQNSVDEILAKIDSEPEDEEEEEEEKSTRRKRKVVVTKDKQTNRKKERGTWIREAEDEIVDLLDASLGQALVSKRPIMKSSRNKEVKDRRSGEGFKVDKASGKLIISEDNDKGNASKIDFMDDVDEYLRLKEGAQSGKIKNRKRQLSGGSDNDDDDDLFAPPAKVSGIGRKEKVKKTAMKNRHDYGSEFRSKKAGGDMIKNNKSPYAYIQFSKERLNKRKKAKFEGQFKSIVRGAKKGISKGSRMKGRKRSMRK